MSDSLMLQVSAKMPSLGIMSSSVPEGVGGDGSPAANFTDLLQAIVSGLDKGLGNLQGGSIIRADGKTASSDNLMELMQKLSNGKGTGSDKKSDSVHSMTDVLQEMMAQLQTSFAQPVIFIAPEQSNNTSSSSSSFSSSDVSSIAATGMDSGNGGAGALIAALESAIQKGDVKKQSEIGTPELPDTGQTAGKQPDMDSVPLTQYKVVADQNALGAVQDNSQTSGANLEVAAFSMAAQKNLTNNTDRPLQNTAKPDIANTARLDIANASALNTAGTATLNTASTPTLSTATLNSAKTATLNAADAATQNTTNDTLQNSGRGTINSLTEGTTGAFGIKGMSLTLNNGNKATSGDADSNTAFSPVALQQTRFSSDANSTQEALPVNKLNELGDPIMKTLGSGEKNLVIKLSPPDMGTIEIRLKMENGVLTADFKVDSTAVKDLFSIAMPQIKNSIEGAGIKTGNFFADLKDDRSTGGGRQQDSNQQQQRQQKEQKQSFFDFFA